MRPDGPRDPVAGPSTGPEAPFPIKLWGPVIKGFGRGSKELGIPTANIPPDGLSSYPDLKSGVYYGFVGLNTSNSKPLAIESTKTSSPASVETYPAVLSIGYNPFYKNTVRSVEIHVLHPFTNDFYGASLNLLMLGFIRPEYDYVSKDSLIEDIMTDCDVAKASLNRPAYAKSSNDPWLREFAWAAQTDVKKVEERVLGGEA